MDELSDEERQILDLRRHQALREKVQDDLKDLGIKTEATMGNDPSGDILILDPSDVDRVQEYIRDLNDRYSHNVEDEQDYTVLQRVIRKIRSIINW